MHELDLTSSRGGDRPPGARRTQLRHERAAHLSRIAALTRTSARSGSRPARVLAEAGAVDSRADGSRCRGRRAGSRLDDVRRGRLQTRRGPRPPPPTRPTRRRVSSGARGRRVIVGKTRSRSLCSGASRPPSRHHAPPLDGTLDRAASMARRGGGWRPAWRARHRHLRRRAVRVPAPTAGCLAWRRARVLPMPVGRSTLVRPAATGRPPRTATTPRFCSVSRAAVVPTSGATARIVLSLRHRPVRPAAHDNRAARSGRRPAAGGPGGARSPGRPALPRGWPGIDRAGWPEPRRTPPDAAAGAGAAHRTAVRKAAGCCADPSGEGPGRVRDRMLLGWRRFTTAGRARCATPVCAGAMIGWAPAHGAALDRPLPYPLPGPGWSRGGARCGQRRPVVCRWSTPGAEATLLAAAARLERRVVPAVEPATPRVYV